MKPPDDIARPPDLHYRSNRAWRVPILRAHHEAQGILATWLIEAPNAEPAFCHSYVVDLFNLHIPTRETNLYLPNATHEMWLSHLDPSLDRPGAIARHYLRGTQPHFAAQFIDLSDEDAKERVRRSVEMICLDTLSPARGNLIPWSIVFGANMLKGDRVAAHQQAESPADRHPAGSGQTPKGRIKRPLVRYLC